MPKSPTPSVEEQLRAAKTTHGTKLEKLIRAHQDFDLLHPHESKDDRIGLPLWLRVYWRKNHPESVPTIDDPTGGYPRALRKLHAWMLENQDLPGLKTGTGGKKAKRTKNQGGKGGKS